MRGDKLQRQPSTASTPSWQGVDAVFCAAVLLLAVLVLAKDISGGGFRFGDASAHAMDGVLIHDWVGAGPQAWLSPMEFAARQYAHYPTLGIGRHYPPGYAIVEAGFFALLGVSVFAARCCVVFFGLIAAAGTYAFTRFWANRLTAFMAAIIFATMPATTTWGRQNMLEVPTMAVMIWAAVALAWYLRQPTNKRLAWVAAVAVLAILFKQPAVFLIGVVAIVILVAALQGRCRRAHALALVVIAAVVGAVTILSLDGHGRQLLSGDKTCPTRFGLESLAFYARRLPQQVSVPYLLAAVVGVVLSWRRPNGGVRSCDPDPSPECKRRVAGPRAGAWLSDRCRAFRRGHVGPVGLFLIAWLVACYGMLTLADYKNPRFLYFALFPLTIWAAVAVVAVLSRIRPAGIRVVVTGAVVGGCVAVGMAAPVEHRPDYGPVVLAQRELIEENVILFSGLRDGDFIFAVRQHVPKWRTIVVRGSKLLYTCNARPDLEFASKVSTGRDVAELLDRYSFQHIFVQRENKLKLVEDGLLRDHLTEGDAYRRVAVHQLRADPTPGRWDVTIDVYQASRTQARAVEYFDIPVPRAHRSIRVDLRGWD